MKSMFIVQNEGMTYIPDRTCRLLHLLIWHAHSFKATEQLRVKGFVLKAPVFELTTYDL